MRQNLLTGLSFLATRAFRLLPGQVRQRLKQAAGAAGHAPGWAQDMRARKLAAHVKRLDIAGGHLADLVAFAGFAQLKGARCMEFGTGHLLAEAFAFHLAGAAKVVATDYFRIAQDKHFSLVLNGASDEAVLRALSSCADPATLLPRLDALRRRTDFSPGGLAQIDISYVAPYDAAAGPLEREGFDLITSRSVLEHVPRAAAKAILQGLYDSLAPGGAMAHSIHLDDHRDIDGAPYAFLSADTDWSLAEEDERGNRLRASDWLALAQQISGAETRMTRVDGQIDKLPQRLAPEFQAYDKGDLAARGATLLLRKPA